MKKKITNIIISIVSPELCRALRTPNLRHRSSRGDVGDGGSTLTWLEPPQGVAGHWWSGLGRPAAQAMDWAGCALPLGTLALHRGQSLARRMRKKRRPPLQGAGLGPARWHWALDRVFGFLHWAAPLCRKHRHSGAGHSPWTQPRRSWAPRAQSWSRMSRRLCWTRPIARFLLPFSPQPRGPFWTCCIEMEFQSLLPDPGWAHTFLPAAVFSLLCTWRFFRLWTRGSGCPWCLNCRASQHGCLRFLCTVWIESAFLVKNLKFLLLHLIDLQEDHIYRIQSKTYIYSTLLCTQYTEWPGCEEQISHLLEVAYNDLPGRLKKSEVCREIH